MSRSEGEMSRRSVMPTTSGVPFDRIDGNGELASLRDRHRTVFLDLARRAAVDLEDHGRLAWLDVLEGELDNLRAALTWSIDQRNPAALDLAAALAPLWK